MTRLAEMPVPSISQGIHSILLTWQGDCSKQRRPSAARQNDQESRTPVSTAQRASNLERIIIAERNSMQCELLARALKTEPEFEIVGTASHSRGVLRLLNEFEPGVAVVSADLQDGSGVGLEVIAHVRSKNWRTRTVVLLDRSDRQSVVEAFRRGARGVFLREQPYELFPKCLRTVLQGQVWVNTAEMNYLLEALTSHRTLHLVDANGHSMLTPRESEVAQLVTEGLSNREIAVKLGLSEHTIKNYLFRIFDKTGVSSRVALVLYTMSRQDQAHRTLGTDTDKDGHFVELAV